MPEHSCKVVEIDGSSPVSIEDAVGDASTSLRHTRGFEMVEPRGHVEDAKVAHYQVRLKIGYSLEA